jgi:hypothetical protein
MNKHLRECRALCEEAGLCVCRIEHGGKHLKIICNEGKVTMPSTPSDRRWREKALSFARRLARSHDTRALASM